jgi:hypothetical protein
VIYVVRRTWSDDSKLPSGNAFWCSRLLENALLIRTPRQGHNPVPNRHGREHALLQMHRAVRHTAAEARRAKPAAFATQRDQLRVPAATAGQVKAAPLQYAVRLLDGHGTWAAHEPPMQQN